MRLPEGGFASAQDADTNGVEGLTYSWTPDEVADVLGEEHPEWLQPFEHDRSIVRADVPAEAKERLLATRVKRPQPERDDKVLTGWNGLALGAFAEAGRALGRADYIEEARALGEFLLGPLSEPSGGLRGRTATASRRSTPISRTTRTLPTGCSSSTGRRESCAGSRRLGVFRPSSSSGSPIPSAAASSSTPATGTVSSHAGRNSTITPLRPGTRWPRSCCFDSGVSTATPSSSATPSESFVSRARTWSACLPPSATSSAHSTALFPAAEIAVVGHLDELRAAALAGYKPNTVFAFADAPTDDVPLLAGKGLVGGKPAAYVCENFTCQSPVTDPAELAAVLVT